MTNPYKAKLIRPNHTKLKKSSCQVFIFNLNKLVLVKIYSAACMSHMRLIECTKMIAELLENLSNLSSRQRSVFF